MREKKTTTKLIHNCDAWATVCKKGAKWCAVGFAFLTMVTATVSLIADNKERSIIRKKREKINERINKLKRDV